MNAVHASTSVALLGLPLLGITLLAGAQVAPDGDAYDKPAVQAGPGDATLHEGSLLIDRGQDNLALWIPPGEELVFDVVVDIKVDDITVGSVTLSSGVERYVPGLALPQEKISDDRMVGWLKSSARGGYLGYDLQHDIVARVNPQAWPRTILRDIQKGTENRRRELMIGVREDESISTYRSDQHCAGCKRREHFVESSLPWGDDHHCDKCRRGEHREWKEVVARPVPRDTMDVLGAVFLARTFLRGDAEEQTFAMVDQVKLWDVTLRRGKKRPIKTRAGTFQCSEILLQTARPEGEERDEKDDFAGLFGIRGKLHLWMQDDTGVPTLIEGELPLGDLFNLKVSVVLKKYSGTPEGFVAIGAR